MILYTLSCERDHRFDAWFQDSATYDAQAAIGRVACPACGSTRVEKAIMAPALVSARGGRPSAETSVETLRGEGSEELLGRREKMMRMFMKSVRDKILSEGHDVGTRFPEQARRMHDGEVPVRPIHGQASPREVRDLLDDGIMVLPLPTVPEELN